ncbi:MAG: HypC/HybG/HupF family hydrogenase formation chaperone [Coprothermobacterota bacterium]|nr:HypC/HybG/HupF family hydrogenase formation chaperone [Coprothermobacterota bacterium]
MCLAIPAKIVERDGADALVEMSGVRQRIRMDLLPAAIVGDYVLLHAGFAIALMNEEEAQETLDLLREIDVLSS